MIKFIWFTFLAIFSIVGLGLPGHRQTADAQVKLTDESDKFEQVLSWLPADTESISVARGPFALTIPPTENWTPQTWDPNRAVSDERLSIEFESVPLMLFSFDKGSFLTHISPFEGHK